MLPETAGIPPQLLDVRQRRGLKQKESSWPTCRSPSSSQRTAGPARLGALGHCRAGAFLTGVLGALHAAALTGAGTARCWGLLLGEVSAPAPTRLLLQAPMWLEEGCCTLAAATAAAAAQRAVVVCMQGRSRQHEKSLDMVAAVWLRLLGRGVCWASCYGER